MIVDEKDRLRLGNKIIMITILLNVLLTIMKVGAGYLGKSTATIADGLHSASDIITSVGVIVGMLLASKPRDEKHQYGHEKAESIAGFLLALVLTFTGLKIGYESLTIMISGTFAVPELYTAAIAAVSIAIKEYQFRITSAAAKKLNSNAMMGDAWHHRSDALSSVAALLGILGARMGYVFLDPLAGAIVSLIVVKIGIQLLLAGIDELMDGALDEAQMNTVHSKLKDIDGIGCITEIRGRKHGSKAYVDVKICVDPHISVYKGHNIGEEVEALIKENIENVKDVIVHVDPCTRELEVMSPCKTCNK
ncbi:cation diffusion facilitator family transporter [Geosporobacter ferrireducens]|uniref:Uncharacterized protein n=2 Tax=Geosporobacter ferrireducens TaxID=1424294 RepID=A0A1D8GPY2_9FIRM|nr:cation diffusion facilitator family transporter [Geosporobacter ferrireducens]AOT72996.1 hypothetical protein Gferi_04690 [Geosporobacter ferrireducens]